MSIDKLTEHLKEQLTHELATDVWAAQLKDSNFEDDQVREELEPIAHDTADFVAIFGEVGKLADRISAAGGNVWKTLVDAEVEVDRVNSLFWVFIDRANAKNSLTRDVEYGFAAACCWLKLAGLKGSDVYHFFNRYLYKSVLTVLRVIYRLKKFNKRNATTTKKKAAKGKKGAKAPPANSPVTPEREAEDENVSFKDEEIDDMLEKSCDAIYSLLRTIPLSSCSQQANETMDLVRDLIKLDIHKETHTKPIISQRELNERKRISDQAFGLAHMLCESRHSHGGIIVYTRLVLPRLLCFNLDTEALPNSHSISVEVATARDVIISFLEDRIVNSTAEAELENIAKLVSNMIVRCPDKAEFRRGVSQSALKLLKLLPKKMQQKQLQLLYTLGVTQKGGLRAMLVEMIPTLLNMDLDRDEDDDEERNKSKREKNKESEDEEEGEERKKKGKKESDEEEDDDLNGTKRKIKKEKKKKNKGESDEDDVMDRTRRRKKKKESEEDDEEEDGNTTKRKAKKEKKNKKRGDDDDEDEEEEEEEGNRTKRRRRSAKDESMMRMKKEKKRAEESDGEEEESEGEKEKKRKKKAASLAKKKREERSAPVDLRPSLLMLAVRGCLDKSAGLRSRSLQQVSHMIVEEGMGEDLRKAADAMMRDYPRIIVQAMTHVDDEKEEEGEEEEEDEEKKARTARLAQLAAEELKIKNGLMYVVKSRLEDDNAAVRKSAISAVHTLFFEWNMEKEEAEETANALKLRCLDNSQTVRRQAMETITSLLNMSMEKGHRSILETTWMKAVLPLINDRENTVQSMAAKFIEETLITPITLVSTPLSCWQMLKRVEEEVSNRRLLVRTLAYLSTTETKSMKATVVDTLNRKLVSDPDHSNVIWMLLADLSTVFGDKIDPSTAVNTWYELEEKETANKVSYVAKVVGEGAKKLKSAELDRVSKDMEDKLVEFRVHGPHISTVYLALARLMDAVGELASGKEELERVGSRLLTEGSRIIYNELDMFTEMEDDKQSVAKEDEIRVIRIVITIGEVIQLSPNLIDSADKLFDALKKIMSSELYLSDAFQQRKNMNSALPSRVPSAMGHTVDPSSQASAGSGQTIIYSETGNQTVSQKTVIPSQVQQDIKSLSLRKALFTPTVRRCALTTIGKFCLMDEAKAKACVATFVRQLQFNPDHILRNNVVVVLCDLCIRYTLLVDKYTPIIASCLKDPAVLVRQQTLECLTILIKEAFIRWEGQLMYRFVATILDEYRPIREYAMFCLKDVLLPQKPCMFFDHFIECLLYFNDVPRKYKTAADTIGQQCTVKFSLSGQENEASRVKLYEFMLATFDDRQKFVIMAKMSEEIFAGVYRKELNLDNENVVALLTDAFKVIACEQMQLKLDVGKKTDEDEEEAPQSMQDAAKSMITAVFRTAIINFVMPHVLELRRYLTEKRHPIMKHMFAVLRALTRSHMDQLQEFFAGDRIAFMEIQYDIKRLNNLEEKLKLRAAEAAKKAAEVPPPGQSKDNEIEVVGEKRDIEVVGEKKGEKKIEITGNKKNEKEKKNEKRKERMEVEIEVPVHPNQVEMMEEMEEEGEEMGHIETGTGTSVADENIENIENMESVEVEMEEKETDDNDMEEETEKEKGGEKKKKKKERKEGMGMEDNEEDNEEVEEEGGDMEVEEEKEEEEGGEGGDENKDEGADGEDEVNEEVEVDVIDVAERNEKEKGEKKKKEKKSRAELGELTIKDEPMEVEDEEEKEKEKEKEEDEEINKENEKKEKKRRRKEEKEKMKAIEEVEVKEEPLDEEEFVVPQVGKRKHDRAASEANWLNETAMIGGYGQSTPRKGTPSGEDEGDEGTETAPRFPDLDISAIAPANATLKGRNRISRKPTTGTIEE